MGEVESPFAKSILLAISVLKTLPEAPIDLEEMYKKYVRLEPTCPVCGTLVSKDRVRWYKCTEDLVIVTQRIPNSVIENYSRKW